MDNEHNRVYAAVQDYYGSKLKTSDDLASSACTTSSVPHPAVLHIIQHLPQQILDKFYGCGNPIPLGVKGLDVLDLGSGSGRDCYIIATLVGENGSVTGIDMTDELLQVAQRYADDYCIKTLRYSQSNMRFVKGYIEALDQSGIAPSSLDLVISNCVISLSPNKPAVFQSVYTSLRVGGEFHFSDMYSDRRLPDELKDNQTLYGEGLSSAMCVEDFIEYCRRVGFTDPRVLASSPISVDNKELEPLLLGARFTSITYRLFKVDRLEAIDSDYGQTATYYGTLPHQPSEYVLDENNTFPVGKAVSVSGNTAIILSQCIAFRHHFSISGEQDDQHRRGPFIDQRKATQQPTEAPRKSCCKK